MTSPGRSADLLDISPIWFCICNMWIAVSETQQAGASVLWGCRTESACLCWRPRGIPRVFVSSTALTSGDPPGLADTDGPKRNHPRWCGDAVRLHWLRGILLGSFWSAHWLIIKINDFQIGPQQFCTCSLLTRQSQEHYPILLVAILTSTIESCTLVEQTLQ